MNKFKLLFFLNFIESKNENIITTNEIPKIESLLNNLNYEELVILDLFETLLHYEYDFLKKENKFHAIKCLINLIKDQKNVKKYIKKGQKLYKIDQNFIDFISKLYKKDVKILAISNKKEYKNTVFRENEFLIQDKMYIEGIFYYSNTFKFEKVPQRILAQYKTLVFISSDIKNIKSFVNYCNLNNIKYLIIYFNSIFLEKSPKEIEKEIKNFININCLNEI